MTNLHKIWHDDAERVSSVSVVKILILQVQDGGWPIRVWRHYEIAIFSISKIKAVRYLGVLKNSNV